MGKRVEGRKKQKSIKANVTSKFSSKRKLSRMGKKVKAGKAGPNTEFITRSAALRKLQITLKDFRRLCILKGIYPRVPAKGLQGNDKVYYDIKDISYIMHEPLLNKFREFKSFMKKIRKAAGRSQFGEARRKDELKPKFSLNHLVKERYPRFIDALRDLEDALCMIHLFAALPSVGRITTEHTANCQKLAREWQYYVAKSRSLKKVFVSVKGVYFQAEVLGEAITWLVPHPFTQSLPKEVDFRVMVTFLEFYEVFVKFVLFKLYHMKTWQYPPVVDHRLEAEGCCLLALKSDQNTDEVVADPSTNSAKTDARKKSNLKKIKAIDVSSLLKKGKGSESEDEAEEDEEEEEADISAPLQSAFSDLQSFHSPTGISGKVTSVDGQGEEERVFQSQQTTGHLASQSLFQNLVFFVNREVPLDWCQLCITAFGGKLGWDSPLSPVSVDDPRITHQIVDRPLASPSGLSREVVQPQWIFDSINAALLLPTRQYGPGAKLPPHLSPFVNDDKEGYLPKYQEEINQLKQQRNNPDAIDEEEQEEDEEAEVMEPEELEEVDDFHDKNRNDEENSDDESEEEEEEEEDETTARAKSSSSDKKGPKAIVYQRKEEKVSEEAEAKELSKQMMKKKTKRLYDRMQFGIEKKQQQVESLLQKRKALEAREGETVSEDKTEKRKSDDKANKEDSNATNTKSTNNKRNKKAKL